MNATALSEGTFPHRLSGSEPRGNFPLGVVPFLLLARRFQRHAHAASSDRRRCLLPHRVAIRNATPVTLWPAKPMGVKKPQGSAYHGRPLGFLDPHEAAMSKLTELKPTVVHEL